MLSPGGGRDVVGATVRGVLLFVAVVGLGSCSGDRESPASSSSRGTRETAPFLVPLLKATRNASEASSAEVTSLLKTPPSKDAVAWPAFTFLAGEIYRSRQDRTSAGASYRALAQWAAADPFGDGWGGSGLAMVALWRWALDFHQASDRFGVRALP